MLMKEARVVEKGLRADFEEAQRHSLWMLFMDELARGFEALRVWDGSGEAGALVVSRSSPTGRGLRAAGLGRVHGIASGGGHRLWGDGHSAPGHCDKYHMR